MPSSAAPDPRLGPRFTEAVALAVELHADQARKGGTIPYVAHLLAVAALVLEDDGSVVPKPPWQKRKQDYLDHLESADRGTLRVSMADKLHNARSIHRDYAEVGGELWDRFSASREQTLWYYRSLAEIFARRAPGPMSRELTRTTEELDVRSGAPAAT